MVSRARVVEVMLSGPLAFSDSRILPFGLGPETLETRPRRAGFQPPGPGETFVLLWRGRRLQPRVGGPGGGPVLAPLGCPGESAPNLKLSDSQFSPSNGPLRNGFSYLPFGRDGSLPSACLVHEAPRSIKAMLSSWRSSLRTGCQMRFVNMF